MGCALTDWLLREKQQFIYSWKEKRNWDNTEVEYNRSLTSHEQLREFFAFMQDAEEDFKEVFPFYYRLSETNCLKKEVNSHYYYGEEKLHEPDTVSYLLALHSSRLCAKRAGRSPADTENTDGRKAIWQNVYSERKDRRKMRR